MSTTALLSGVLVGGVVLNVVLWLRLPRPRRPMMRTFGVLLWTALALEAYGLVTLHFCWNNLPAYNLFGLLEFLLVLVLAARVLQRGKTLLAAAGVVGLVSFGASVMVHGWWNFLYIETILLNALVLTLFCLWVLWLLAQERLEPLYHLPAFWLFAGLLLYFGGIVPTIGTIRLVHGIDPDLSQRLWILVQSLAILRYGFSAVACALERGRNTGSGD